jgi:hypothetical protein
VTSPRVFRRLATPQAGTGRRGAGKRRARILRPADLLAAAGTQLTDLQKIQKLQRFNAGVYVALGGVGKGLVLLDLAHDPNAIDHPPVRASRAPAGGCAVG